jgi:hypothetical protein
MTQRYPKVDNLREKRDVSNAPLQVQNTAPERRRHYA